MALVRRMDAHDTRIECADWIKENITKDRKVGWATFFPWNYTPPIETFLPRPLITGYDYENLLRTKPDFFLITEYEYRELANSYESEVTSEEFVEKLFSEERYAVVKELKRDFEVFGITFMPHFPNMNWNPVSPTIYVFEAKF
jgi:hypothetical protein